MDHKNCTKILIETKDLMEWRVTCNDVVAIGTRQPADSDTAKPN